MTDILTIFGRDRNFIISVDRDCINSLINNESYEVMRELIANKVYLLFKS